MTLLSHAAKHLDLQLRLSPLALDAIAASLQPFSLVKTAPTTDHPIHARYGIDYQTALRKPIYPEACLFVRAAAQALCGT
jgi:hypothetical protein